ncbi:MAG: T9SS type A sorting domain-containing protein [Arcicella sp.]|nr:T9SS type A sorting domain-containing protein [Arcicella sp.]
MKNIITTALMLIVGMSAMAQKSISQNINENNGKMTIHIESSEKGKKEVFEKSYNVEGMSDAEKENLISRVTDSLWTASGDGDRKQFKIKIDRNEDRHIDSDDDRPSSFNSPKGKTKKRVEIYKDGKKIEKDLDGDGDNDITMFFKDFGNDMEKKFKNFDHKEMFSSLEPMMKDFKFKMDGDMKDFDFMNESKTVKALKIYPNKPFDNKLNLKFYAPEKGDVSVIVTDISGKEVGSQKFKDFQGDFMGQVDLKKNVKGTLFVTVTQGQDGTAKRVVVE